MATSPHPIRAHGATSTRRIHILSGASESAVDVRKACNGIKRTASLSAAAMLTGIDPKRSVELAESMAMTALRSAGFDVSDEVRLASVLPMMIEASCIVLADAAHRAGRTALAGSALDEAAMNGVATIVEVIKSRSVAKMSEQAYPSDMDAVIALRLTAAAAVTHVAVEISEFDFAHSAVACIREAGKVVVNAALEAAENLAPKQASNASRLMLSQSLIHSAAKVYGATWKAVAREEMTRMNGLSDFEWNAEMDAMGKSSLALLLVPINARFSAAFVAISDVARAAFAEADEPIALRRTLTARPH